MLPHEQHHPNGGGHHVDASNHLQTHLTKFAFLLSSARGESSDEPVVGMHHDVEMAACFSERHMRSNGGISGMMSMATPPSISSSSLSMQSKNGQRNDGMRKKSTLMEIAAMNMSTPFYTTPDTVSSTAKTILKNTVTTMEELMDSRLRSTVSQLVQKSGKIANSQLIFRLLSPSRNPIQVATVITRFVIPSEGDSNYLANVQQASMNSDDFISIPLQYKAVLDIKIFGVVSTVELSAPVTMSSKFDKQDGLLTAVDVSFDCASLLKVMISQARSVVKTAVTKAAALSVQIAEWAAKKKAASLAGIKKVNESAFSLRSLLGSTVSLGSLNSQSLNSQGDGANLSDLFASFSSMSNFTKGSPQQPSVTKLLKTNGPGPGLLRNSSRNANTMASLLKNRNVMGNNSSQDNTNETFDFSGGSNVNHNSGNMRTSGSTVRFCMPNSSPAHSSCQNASASTSTSSSFNNMPQHQQHAPQHQQVKEEEQPKADKGNIHAGLFSWLQDDKMFLTEEKIQEQNAADAERERKLREAPMPLRFFTAAEDLGGGQCGLEIVSKSIFGGSPPPSEMNLGDKRFQQVQGGGNNKRRKIWQ